MYQTKLATLVLCLEHSYESRADQVADLLPPLHWVQSVTLPPTLHPHLPQHLIETLAKEGDGTIREALFAVLHAGAAVNLMQTEHQLEALSFALKNCDLELCATRLANITHPEACDHNGLSSSAVQYIGLLGLRVSSSRNACIKMLQRAVLWSEGDVAQEALGYLLDLLYLTDFNEEACQCYVNLFAYFGRAKRYESHASTLAYGILRQVKHIGPQSPYYARMLETVLNNQTNPTIEQMAQLFEATEP